MAQYGAASLLFANALERFAVLLPIHKLAGRRVPLRPNARHRVLDLRPVTTAPLRCPSPVGGFVAIASTSASEEGRSNRRATLERAGNGPRPSQT